MQAEQDGVAVRKQAQDLASQAEKARGECSQARKELEKLRHQADDGRAELAALVDAVVLARQERAAEAEVRSLGTKRLNAVTCHAQGVVLKQACGRNFSIP